LILWHKEFVCSVVIVCLDLKLRFNKPKEIFWPIHFAQLIIRINSEHPQEGMYRLNNGMSNLWFSWKTKPTQSQGVGDKKYHGHGACKANRYNHSRMLREISMQSYQNYRDKASKMTSDKDGKLARKAQFLHLLGLLGDSVYETSSFLT
jgi:hypothetical protein